MSRYTSEELNEKKSFNYPDLVIEKFSKPVHNLYGFMLVSLPKFKFMEKKEE